MWEDKFNVKVEDITLKRWGGKGTKPGIDISLYSKDGGKHRVGAIQLSKLPEFPEYDDLPGYFVYWVWVDDDLQGQGIGTFLYEIALKKAGALYSFYWDRGLCTAEAARVWDKLKKMYPHKRIKGDVLEVTTRSDRLEK